jgi:glycosyltransferase involved in cell wall biosynthesis
VHAPSNYSVKGTKYVRQCIENLHNLNYDFQYIEINNCTKAEANLAMSKCDIFIDQLIMGSYGLAACEAMAMGKPTLCYIMPAVEALFPSSLPIVNTTIDNLIDKVTLLLDNSALRNEIGVKSRAYVEQYHDSTKIALQMLDIFKK